MANYTNNLPCDAKPCTTAELRFIPVGPFFFRSSDELNVRPEVCLRTIKDVKYYAVRVVLNDGTSTWVSIKKLYHALPDAVKYDCRNLREAYQILISDTWGFESLISNDCVDSDGCHHFEQVFQLKRLKG